MKKNPLAKSESGTSRSTKTTVMKSKGTTKSAAQYRNNAVNSMKQNPGFSGSVK